MNFIKKIREKLGYTKYKMAQELGYANDKGYHQFEDSKKIINIEKLVKLWHISGLNADEFVKMMEEEVTKDNKDK